MFKIGQTVRRIKADRFGSMKVGDTAVIERVVDGGGWLILKGETIGTGQVCLSSNFELVEEKKNYSEYTFSVSSPFLEDRSDIQKELSRDRPLAIVKCSDGTVSVVIHQSIFMKSCIMDPEYSQRLEDALDDLLAHNKLSDGKLKGVVKAVKDIRNGSILKEYKNPVEYTVTILEV